MSTESPFLKVALEAAKAAEKEILAILATDFSVEAKSDQTPVTTADKRGEEIIKEIIGRAFPEHSILGEEEGLLTRGSTYKWIIDPIDGTKNAIRGIPFWGIELALLQEEEIILGVSSIPLFNQLLWGEKNKGAFCNGQPIAVSQRNTLQDAYLSFGNIKYFDGSLKKSPVGLQKIAQEVFQARSFGDAFAYQFLARGMIDIILEAHAKIWDVAAMIAIVEAAGGKVTDFFGKPITSANENISLVTTNGLVHEQILEKLV